MMWTQGDQWPWDGGCILCTGRDGVPILKDGSGMCPHCVREIVAAVALVPRADLVAQTERTKRAQEDAAMWRDECERLRATHNAFERERDHAIRLKDEQRVRADLLQERLDVLDPPPAPPVTAAELVTQDLAAKAT